MTAVHSGSRSGRRRALERGELMTVRPASLQAAAEQRVAWREHERGGEAPDRTVGGRSRYVVDGHDVVLRGECPQCADR